jgi:lariat debranching enzyme
VAPNIYFLGMSGVVNFGGLRIGGLSGIYKKFDYKKGTPLPCSIGALSRRCW